MRDRDELRRHLDEDYTKPIRDPLWKHIYLTPGLLSLLNSPAVQQLSRIKQLGPAFQVYPGATHTRLAHSLGVFSIAKRMVRSFMGYPDRFPADPAGTKAFLCAALLHDLGHFPYAHSLKELPLEEHEALGARLVEEDPLAGIIRDEVGADPATVAAIIDLSRPDGNDPQIGFFRRILSGPLDPDKLDYLTRDAYFCGVPYGVQDIDFALSRIRPHEHHGIVLHASGISAIENILFSKYLMYRAVYWHRTVRVATAMIKKALYLALSEGLARTDELYGLDDELFFSRFADRDMPCFGLIKAVAARRHYRVALEEPYPPHDLDLAFADDLTRRTDLEAAIARRLSQRLGSQVSPLEVIVDLPEKVSFEVSLPVETESGIVPYSQSETVFTPQVVRDFTRTLRRLRIIVAPRHEAPASILREALYEASPA